MDTENPTDIIKALGGTTKVARIFGISPAAVSQWRAEIPKLRLMYLRVAFPQIFRPIGKTKSRASSVKKTPNKSQP